MPLEVPIAREIWEAKYRFCPLDGSGDADFSATAARVAQAVAANEKPALRKVWEQRFAEAIETLTFIPAGAFWPAQARAARSPCSTAS